MEIKRLIEDMLVNVVFKVHSTERLDRTGLSHLALDEEDVMRVFSSNLNGEPLVWAIQDLIKPNVPQTMVLIDESNYMSLVVSVYYDSVCDDLNFDIITIWHGLDIRTAKGQTVLRLKSVV